MAKKTGLVYVSYNGKLLQSMPGASIDIGGFERTAQKGHAVYGYSEAVMESTVECTIHHDADLDLRELADFVDGNVTFECDTGITYLVPNAYTATPPVLTDGGEGVSITFKGDPAVVA